MSRDPAGRARPSQNLLIRYKALNGEIETICPTPQFLTVMFGERNTGEKRCWRDRGDREGQCLIFVDELDKVRWLRLHIDLSDLYRSFDEPVPERHAGTDLPDGLDGEELSERDAAEWIDVNGEALPTRLMGRTLAGKPERAAAPVTAAGRPHSNHTSASPAKPARAAPSPEGSIAEPSDLFGEMIDRFMASEYAS